MSNLKQAVEAALLRMSQCSRCKTAHDDLRAAHEAHDYDRLDWSLMQAKVAETAMATMRAEKAEAERDEARAEVERLRKDWLAVAQAVGVVYEADGHDPVAGPAKEVIAQARKNRDQALIAEEWELCEERDELRAEVERLRRERDEARREGAREALNRMRALLGDQALENTSAGKIPFAFYATAQDAAVRDIDRILADYAEPDEQPGPEVWGSLKDLEDGREDAEPNLEVDGCGVPFYSRAEREDAEGDDVLREWVAMVDDADYPIDLRAKVIAELCRAELRRRALGGAK